MQKWGNLNELAHFSGLSLRTLAYIRRQEPNVLVFREKGKRVEYDIPACNTKLRARERAMAIKEAEPKDLFEAELRKAAADARLAEIKVAREEGQLVTIEDSARLVEGLLSDLRAQLITLPQRVAPSLVGAKTVVEVQTRLDQAIAEMMTNMSAG